MNKKFILIYIIFQLIAITNLKGEEQMDKNVYNYIFTAIDGKKELSLSQFKGKVILIVNTASKCGFTKQYDGLEKLYNKYKEQGLVIIGVPSNDFGGQEPGENEEVEKFCKINYGVTFPLTTKEVVSGSAAHPFYLWAKGKLGFASAPKWNFHKYLIDREGKLVDFFLPTTIPESKGLVQKIEEYIKK